MDTSEAIAEVNAEDAPASEAWAPFYATEDGRNLHLPAETEGSRSKIFDFHGGPWERAANQLHSLTQAGLSQTGVSEAEASGEEKKALSERRLFSFAGKEERVSAFLLA